MQTIYIQFSKIGVKIFLILTLGLIFIVSNIAKTQADEYITSNDCSFELYFIGPDGKKINADSINIPKGNESGYKVQIDIQGPGCGPNFYTGTLYMTGGYEGAPDTRTKCEFVKRGLQNFPLDFKGAQDQKFVVWYFIRDENCENRLDILEITASPVNNIKPPTPTNNPPTNNGGGTGGSTPPVNTQYTVGKVDYDASFGSLQSLINPTSVPAFLAALLRVFFLGIASWALLMILLGALRMVMSHGNEEAITAGKKTVTWAVIGFVVALMSYSIVAILQTALGVQ